VTLALLNSAAAQAAFTALLTLNTGSFATTITALVAAAGPGAYTTNAVSTTAACGNGACSLPQGSTSDSPAVNVGAVIGGVIGGFAALAIFVAAVVYVRHQQKIKATSGSGGASALPAATPAAAQAAPGLSVPPKSPPAAAAASPTAAPNATAV
jgi:hypothetical protein